MSLPSQGLREPRGLPPKPYAAEDDAVVQQWQSNGGAERAELMPPREAVLPASSSGHEMQPEVSAQGLYPWQVSYSQAERYHISEGPEDNTRPANLRKTNEDDFSEQAAVARAQYTRAFPQFDNGLAVDMQGWSQNVAQNMTYYPQTWLGGGGLLRDVVDGAEQDEQTQFDGGTRFDTYTWGTGSDESLPVVAALDMSWQLDSFFRESVDGRRNAASESLSPLSRPRDSRTNQPTSFEEGPLSDMQYPDLGPDMDETAFQHVLPTTERRETEPNNSEGQAKSAALSKALSEARSKRTTSLMEPVSTHSANTLGPHSNSDTIQYPPDMSQPDPHTYLDARDLNHVDGASLRASRSASETSELDISSFLDSQEPATAHQPKPIQNNHRPEQIHIYRISEIVVDICRSPRDQREKEAIRLLTSLGLSQSQQHRAFKIYADMAAHNKETKKDAEPLVFRKWLCLLIYDVQTRASAANSASKNINDARIKGLFCKEGIHQLKCGHTCRSNEECGMNCVIFSSYPDTPIIDVRMSELPCNECGNWL
ncbi:hypothetical protein M436DRAFT_84567 [Aureobasidium namibiae CBS 147.97]|uniref:Uncharacterized protein n=1 Tax=Aureobasidium namibiae CBS 147.97 TaxID=1043004 RepID=A0A074WBI5_9PEZI